MEIKLTDMNGSVIGIYDKKADRTHQFGTFRNIGCGNLLLTMIDSNGKRRC